MIRFKRNFPWLTLRATKPEVDSAGHREPLREFVYLDEVSLGSLLASQKGEITENITSQIGSELATEVGGKVSTANPILPSGEINSRFQTTNSNSLQTVRKATVQSLFRELHKLQYLRKIQPMELHDTADSLEDMCSTRFRGAVHTGSELARGDLVEFRVKLSASWIFQVSTMVAEFSEMFDESPAIFIENVRFSDLYQAQNANKVISKLLAGLIPVDGIVLDYVVVQYKGNKIIAHKDVIRDINIESQPLRIVGVTDHLAYWKDIRRILFADNEFTMLCRLSKSGIQDNWNPIKVADIFSEFAPDMARQIEAASRIAMIQSTSGKVDERVEPAAAHMALALARYKDALVKHFDHTISSDVNHDLDRSIIKISTDNISAEGQRAAFAAVRDLVEFHAKVSIDPSVDLEMRESIRRDVDLPLFPRPSSQENSPTLGPIIIDETDRNLLDVEVVAIYW